MEQIFNPTSYYRWLHGRGQIYIKHNDKYTFVESGQCFTGDFLNSADNIDEIEFGCLINWVELPKNNSIDEIELNNIVNNLSLEECFELLPNPANVDNINSLYPIIKKVYIQNNGNWTISINDWYGSKDQITLFSIENENLKYCLQSAIMMLLVRGIISIREFLEKYKYNK